MRSSWLLSFFFLLLPLQTFAEVYDVSTTAELREALASAAETGGDNTIRLAAGTYSTQDDGGGTLRYIPSKNSSLEMIGADRSTTIIDGSEIDKVLLFLIQDGLTLETLKMSAITITNGLDDGTSDSGGGGGVEVDVDTGLVMLDDMYFSQNVAGTDGRYSKGGAVLLRGRTPLQVSNSTFINNAASGDGGAVYSCQWDIKESTFTSNVAENKGGALMACGAIFSNKQMQITDSEFVKNSAKRNGAIGIVACNGVYGGHKNNIFKENTADIFGVSEFCGLVEGNSFINNTAGRLSVGAYGTHVNNIFINSQSESGPDLVLYGGYITNNLFAGTSLEIDWDVVLSNNVFVSNEVDITPIGGTDFYTISNNYIDTSKFSESIINTGGSNIFDGINLGFVKAEEGDYRLTSSSGLIDAGTTDPELAYITDYDYTGTTARVIGASIDIGPYEYDGEAPADSDGDGLNDNTDNCPSIANEDQADNDSDGEGDVCDSDDDNDGTNDEDDAFPFDDAESLDTDGDGIGNNEDEDDDGDGFLDGSDPQPVIANVFAIDSDGDGVADSIDDYPTDATKQFGSDGDLDGDGFTNDEEVDYCTNPFDKNSQPELGGLSLPLIQVITEQ
jgi:hypothetical protein